jgi:hypothetical protein
VNPKTIEWLRAGPAWIRYRTLVDLLDFPVDDPLVQQTRTDMLEDAAVQKLIHDCRDWETTVLKRHNDAWHPMHKLSFLADIGLQAEDPGMEKVIGAINAHTSPEGPLQVLTNIPIHFGGSGKDEWDWMLCDAPLLLYCLAKLGHGNDTGIQKAITHLLGLGRENGWPCAVSSGLGKFHGPGRREDPCPYANLLMLKLLTLYPEYYSHASVQYGIESALALWENSQNCSPYLFRMGTNFRKLKTPFIWYDILHASSMLSFFPQVRKDNRFRNMVQLITEKADENGLYTPESIWTKWKGWEFTQKKEPSRWLTFLILKMQKNLGLIS